MTYVVIFVTALFLLQGSGLTDPMDARDVTHCGPISVLITLDIMGVCARAATNARVECTETANHFTCHGFVDGGFSAYSPSMLPGELNWNLRAHCDGDCQDGLPIAGYRDWLPLDPPVHASGSIQLPAATSPIPGCLHMVIKAKVRVTSYAGALLGLANVVVARAPIEYEDPTSFTICR